MRNDFFKSLSTKATLFAAGGFVQLADTSQSPMFTQIYQSGDLAAYVNTIFRISLSVGAILAVLRLAYAGYLYMTSEAFHQTNTAKEIIGDAIIGLLLLLSIYLILYQINPDLLNLNVLSSIKSGQ